jgi:hypothetical protein
VHKKKARMMVNEAQIPILQCPVHNLVAGLGRASGQAGNKVNFDFWATMQKKLT